MLLTSFQKDDTALQHSTFSTARVRLHKPLCDRSKTARRAASIAKAAKRLGIGDALVPSPANQFFGALANQKIDLPGFPSWGVAGESGGSWCQCSRRVSVASGRALPARRQTPIDHGRGYPPVQPGAARVHAGGTRTHSVGGSDGGHGRPA